jgi:hypothetical protein
MTSFYQFTSYSEYQLNFNNLFFLSYKELPSPYINRFLQPDTIVPGAANPQAWNRYSYVLGNPLKYTDPTGHIQENDEDGGLTVAGYTYVVEQRFDWELEGDWSLEEVRTIYQTGHDIETYLDGLTNGNGLAWMVNRFGNTTIDHVNFADGHSDTWPTFSGPQIRLNDNWLNDGWGANVVFAHELGHVWDINSNFGASYLMNIDLGGSGACLVCAPGNGVPKWGPSYHPHEGGAYGNSGRNEYFAEAFAAAIYNRGDRGVVGAAAWIDSNISVPLYYNPWTGQR